MEILSKKENENGSDIPLKYCASSKAVTMTSKTTFVICYFGAFCQINMNLVFHISEDILL